MSERYLYFQDFFFDHKNLINEEIVNLPFERVFFQQNMEKWEKKTFKNEKIGEKIEFNFYISKKWLFIDLTNVEYENVQAIENYVNYLKIYDLEGIHLHSDTLVKHIEFDLYSQIIKFLSLKFLVLTGRTNFLNHILKMPYEERKDFSESLKFISCFEEHSFFKNLNMILKLFPNIETIQNIDQKPTEIEISSNDYDDWKNVFLLMVDKIAGKNKKIDLFVKFEKISHISFQILINMPAIKNLEIYYKQFMDISEEEENIKKDLKKQIKLLTDIQKNAFSEHLLISYLGKNRLDFRNLKQIVDLFFNSELYSNLIFLDLKNFSLKINSDFFKDFIGKFDELKFLLFKFEFLGDVKNVIKFLSKIIKPLKNLEYFAVRSNLFENLSDEKYMEKINKKIKNDKIKVIDFRGNNIKKLGETDKIKLPIINW